MHLVGNCPLFHRGKVPWALGFKGFPKSLIFMIFLTFFYKANMKMVDEDGWILEFGAENDTK